MKYRFKIAVSLIYSDITIESEEVELSDEEVALIKQIVAKSSRIDSGLMPILKEGANELYEKVLKAIEIPLREVVIEDGRKNGCLDPDTDEMEQVEWDCVEYRCLIPDFARNNE